MMTHFWRRFTLLQGDAISVFLALPRGQIAEKEKENEMIFREFQLIFPSN